MNTINHLPEESWLCCVEGVPLADLLVWLTRDKAADEAERLALLPGNVGKRVYVMGPISYCRAGTRPIVWTNL